MLVVPGVPSGLRDVRHGGEDARLQGAHAREAPAVAAQGEPGRHPRALPGRPAHLHRQPWRHDAARRALGLRRTPGHTWALLSSPVDVSHTPWDSGRQHPGVHPVARLVAMQKSYTVKLGCVQTCVRQRRGNNLGDDFFLLFWGSHQFRVVMTMCLSCPE